MRIGWCWSIFPLFFLTLVALPPSFYHQSSHFDDLRISLVKDNDLVPSCWEGHFSLRKRLDLVPHYVYTTFVSPCLLMVTYRSSEAFSSSTPSLYASPSNACARQWIEVVFPIPGIPWSQLSSELQTHRNDDMRDISIFRNDL